MARFGDFHDGMLVAREEMSLKSVRVWRRRRS